jgi:hypothetical protein
VNHRRLYEYRSRDVDQRRRDDVWAALAPMLHDALGRPERVLDPAAGRCEFINAVPATERWAAVSRSWARIFAIPFGRASTSPIAR